MEKVSRRDAASRAAWGLLFLAGIFLPVLAGAAVFDRSTQVRLTWVLLALALTDVPLAVAGARGHGPHGGIQPWRWPAYLFWLGIRLAIFLPLALVPPAET